MAEPRDGNSSGQPHKRKERAQVRRPVGGVLAGPQVEAAQLTAGPETAGQAALAELLQGPGLAAEDGSLGNQAARLGDARLQTAQRHALATHVGRAQGNRYMQRVVGSFQPGEEATPQRGDNGKPFGQAHDKPSCPSPSNGAARARSVIQPKLQVNEPDDQFEQEADQVADAVLSMPAYAATPPPDEGDEGLSRASVARSPAAYAGAPDVSPELEGRIQGIQGTGKPLPPTERAYFEERMGADFGGVRLHTGGAAAQTARDLSARAYTLGSDVVFGAGEYELGTESGRRLVAHELTHVVQQGGAGALRRKPASLEEAVKQAQGQVSDSDAEAEQVDPIEVPEPDTKFELPVEGAAFGLDDQGGAGGGAAAGGEAEGEGAEATPEEVAEGQPPEAQAEVPPGEEAAEEPKEQVEKGKEKPAPEALKAAPVAELRSPSAAPAAGGNGAVPQVQLPPKVSEQTPAAGGNGAAPQAETAPGEAVTTAGGNGAGPQAEIAPTVEQAPAPGGNGAAPKAETRSVPPPAVSKPAPAAGGNGASPPVKSKPAPAPAASKPAPAPGGNGAAPKTEKKPGAAGAQAPAAAGDKAPAAAEEDPAFQAVVGQTQGVAAEQQVHEPTEQKTQESQAAAEMPGEERTGLAQDVQAGEIESAAAVQEADAADGSAPGFDKEAFVSAIESRITELTPEDPREMEDIDKSGVMGKIKEFVDNKVKDGKEEAQGTVDDKVEEEPDESAVPEKDVTPLEANDAGSGPRDVDASGAAPKSKGQSEVETPLQEESQSLDQQMAEADITEEQLEKSNEPEFQSVLESKKDAQEHAETDPQEYRSFEQGTISQAQAGADTTEQTQTQAMFDTRSQVFTNMDGLQTDAKTADEGERTRIGQEINSIYETTKSKVEEILTRLDSDVDTAFNEGAKQAETNSIDYIKRETKAYKDERYGRDEDSNPMDFVKGIVVQAGDLFTDMPPEYYEIYKQGRQKYVDEMREVLNAVADIVADALAKAKQEIADGRQKIADFVAEQPEALREVAQEAAGNIQSKFDELEQTVDAKQYELIDRLAQQYSENLQALDDKIEEMKQKDKGLLARAKDAIVGVIETILELKDMLMDMLSRAQGAIETIIKAPIKFLGNLIEAVKMGFMQFVSNIGSHLKSALLNWLTGTLGPVGITLPETFDLKGIFSLVLQILGLTYENIRAQIVQALGPRGEEIVSAMETAWDVLQIIRTEGLAGLWDYVKGMIGDLKAMVIEQIKEMVITQVIKVGIEMLISILGGPAGAFIKAVRAIIDIVKWFAENARKLMTLVNSIIDSISQIAAGNLSGAANFIENSLAQALPMVIGFLADLLHLGDIADKIQAIIAKIREPINKAIQWLVKKAKAMFKTMGKMLGFGGEEEGDKEGKERQAISELERIMDAKDSTPVSVKERLPGIQSKYELESQPSLKSLKKGADTYYYVQLKESPKTDEKKLKEDLPLEVGSEVSLEYKKTRRRAKVAKIGDGKVGFTYNKVLSSVIHSEKWVLENKDKKWTFLDDEAEEDLYEPKIYNVVYSDDGIRTVTYGYEDEGLPMKFTVKQRLSDYMTTSIEGKNLSIQTGRKKTETPDEFIKNQGWNRSHLIANWFGGSGYRESLNIISASAQFNKVMLGIEEKIVDKVKELGADTFDMAVEVNWGKFITDRADVESEKEIEKRVTSQVEIGQKAKIKDRTRQFIEEKRMKADRNARKCEDVVYSVTFKRSGRKNVKEEYKTGPDKWIKVE